MEQPRLWIAVVVAMMMLPFNCLATDYTVGGSSHWTLGVNYTNWASGETFAVGDNLVFEYTAGRHDVLEVNKTAYDSCTITNSLANYTTGNDTISLNTTGTHNYICGYSTHCSQGMKLAITVGTASASTPPSVNSTGPSASPPPSTAATSYPMDGVAFVGASLVFAMIWL